RRVVAVGSLHGDMSAALSVLRMAGVIDDGGKWAGGSHTVLVQTGNVIDYGPDTKDLLTLFPRLVQEANRAGGRVMQLLGRHELMNMLGDLRFVRERSDEFLTSDSRATTFSPTGYLGFRLFNLPAVHQIGDTIFAHGGILPAWATKNIYAINRLVADGLISYTNKLKNDASAVRPPILDTTGPLQCDGYMEGATAPACSILEHTLSRMGVKRMVIGSSLQENGTIRSQCNGQLFSVNVGISSAIRGNKAALEI
ncbi:Metallo-dependent phosphatase-like protein, partial [Thamnocephalis sphaerospora]